MMQPYNKTPVVTVWSHLCEDPERAALTYGAYVNHTSDCVWFGGIDRKEAQGTFWKRVSVGVQVQVRALV